MPPTAPRTWLGIALLAAAPVSASARVDPDLADAPAGPTITSAALTTEGLDAAALREALALRLPGLRLDEDAADCAVDCVLVRARRGPDGAVDLTVWLADGRSYARALAPQLDQPERAVATSLAHLLAAIEDGTATPAAEPRPVPPTVVPEVVKPAPPQISTREPAPIVRPPPRRAPPPRWQIGPTLGLVSVLGVGPPRALAGSVGSGVALELELRGPRGLLLAFGTRVLQARDSGFRLQRVRLALATGYELRRGAFDLRALAAVSVEPWWVAPRADGTRRDGGPPLLGGAVALTPGLAGPIARGVLVHVGLRLEAAASAGAGSGSAIQAVDLAGMPLFRLGGLELAALAEIGVRWELARRR